MQTPSQIIQTSAGPIPVPCYFRKANYMAALYETSGAILDELLYNTDCKPALKLGTKYYMALGFIEYIDSDLGAYNEVILSVPCIPKGEKQSIWLWLNLLSSLKNRKVLQYVPQIYVTSALSMAAGREIWGFPKELCQIKASTNISDYYFEISDATNNMICSLKGNMGIGLTIKTPDMLTLTFKNGKAWATPVHVDNTCKVYFKPNLHLQLGNSQHQLAKVLERLGLSNARPMLVFSAADFKAVFEAGAQQIKKP